MVIRIGCMNYGNITPVYQQVEPSLPKDVKLIYLQGIFEDTIKQAKKLEQLKAVDVFLTSGSNAHLVRTSTTLPMVEISPSGFDLLLAIYEAVSNAETGIGVITFQSPLPVLHKVSGMFPIPIISKTFSSSSEMDVVLDELQADGINDVIGGYLACSRARVRGMRGYNLVSENSILMALQHAIEIGRTRKREMRKTKQFHTILEWAHEAIVAVDEKNRITLFNRRAEEITYIKRQVALGKSATKVIPNSRLDQVLRSGKPEINQIQVLQNTKILTNRVPIIINEDVAGVVATFQTIDEVQEAEHNIRRNLFTRGFIAKNHFHDIIGKSERLAKIKEKAARFAKSTATILIQGETGTGKELFAQSIHNASDRRKMPFVSVNCAAFPAGLLESELFGYEEGAFTGAKKGGKFGVFELAHEGTIFLDEIGEISLDIQARLLRILEERQIFRIGGEKIINVNVRVIAATNKDLHKMVQEGSFREDLYYRINVLSLTVPSLRERVEDIPYLMYSFLADQRPDLPRRDIERIVYRPAFLHYPWHGNIRQLRNATDQIAALYKPGDNINELLCEMGFPAEQEHSATLIDELLKRFDGNRSKTAEYLGISRATLWRKLQNRKSGSER